MSEKNKSQVKLAALVVASILMIGGLVIFKLPTFYWPNCVYNCVPVNLEMFQVLRISMALFFAVAFLQAQELKHHLLLQLFAVIGIAAQAFNIQTIAILMRSLHVAAFSTQWMQLHQLLQWERLSGFFFCLLVIVLYWASRNYGRLNKALGPLARIIEPKS